MTILRLFAVLLVGSMAPAMSELKTLSGERYQGDLLGMNEKEIVLRTGERVVKVPMADVLELNLLPSVAETETPFTEVKLTDGSVLRCKAEDGVQVDGTQVKLRLLNDHKLQVQRESLSYVLKGARNPDVRTNPDWHDCLKRCLKERRDILPYLGNGRINALSGTFGEGSGMVWNFNADKSVKGNLKQTQIGVKGEPAIQGWIFYNEPAAEDPLCELHDTGHNRIAVSKIEMTSEGLLVQTIGGQLKYSRDQLVRLDFSKGKQEFLSDIEPKILLTPAPDRLDRYRWYDEPGLRNRNLDGSSIQLGGTKFSNGLSLPAPTTLQYALTKKYKHISFVAGVDDTVRGGAGSVILTIEGDGRELFSREIRRGGRPLPIRRNIESIDQLTIKVMPAGVLPYGLRIDLADAKVTK